MESLRMDLDEICGPDIRRRVIESLPSLFASMPQSLPVIVKLLEPHTGDDSYVALATTEACGDIQIKSKLHLTQKEESNERDGKRVVYELLPEVTNMQWQILMNWAGDGQESLQFSIALHNMVQAPDPLLISLEEGLKSEKGLSNWFQPVI
jgi:hypothetical protein